MARTDDYVTEVRNYARMVWEGTNGLQSLQPEWNALDYGNTLPDTQGVTGAQVGAVVFDAANAIRTVMNTGVATNIAKVL